MREKERLELEYRFRDLLDVDALLKGIAAELNSFNEYSSAESMPRQFMTWASQSMAQPHLVLDETSSRVEVDSDMVLAILEAIFLGQTFADDWELIKGNKMSDAFKIGEARLV